MGSCDQVNHSREKREQGFEEFQSTLHIKAKIVSLQAQLGREIAKNESNKVETKLDRLLQVFLDFLGETAILDSRAQRWEE